MEGGFGFDRINSIVAITKELLRRETRIPGFYRKIWIAGRMPHFNCFRPMPNRLVPTGLIIATIVIGSAGCTSLWQGKSEESEQAAALKELMQAPDPPDLIRDPTAPHGMQPIEVEGVGVVNRLPGTGGPPDP